MSVSHASVTHPLLLISGKNSRNFGFFDLCKKLFKTQNLSHTEKTNFFRSSNFVDITKEFPSPEKQPFPLKDSNDIVSQREFMGAIIHELKTPLNAIVGFSQILRDEVRKPNFIEECDDCTQEIIKAANEMDNLIHDLLDVGSQISGNFSVDLSKFIDVRNIVERSMKLNYGYATRSNITIQSDIAENVSEIKLDEKRMKQILTNLISNAAKYSPPRTKIKIVARKFSENKKDFLQIIIVDQGFGMTKEQIKTAFQKYKTIQNPNSEKVDSFGMGLPIVKQLVELQSGTIEMSSEVGKGTEIKLKFPYLM